MKKIVLFIIFNIIAMALLIACGKDVDNIDEEPPAKPALENKTLDTDFEEKGIDAVSEGDYIYLDWQANTEDDFSNYKIYRREGVSPDSPWVELYLPNELTSGYTSFVDEEDDLLVEDGIGKVWSYRLTALDLNGNESDSSLVMKYKLLPKVKIREFNFKHGELKDSLSIRCDYSGDVSGLIKYVFRFYNGNILAKVMPIEELQLASEYITDIEIADDLDTTDLHLRVDVSKSFDKRSFEGSESLMHRMEYPE